MNTQSWYQKRKKKKFHFANENFLEGNNIKEIKVHFLTTNYTYVANQLSVIHGPFN